MFWHKGKFGGGDSGSSGTIYGLAMVGALVYYIRHAATFWEGVVGVVKAIFWPAVLMYRLLDYLKI